MQFASNIILNTDSYKVSMFKQYPSGTRGVYSYIESRGGRHDRTVFFGLQAFIKQYLLTPVTQADIDLADEILTAHGYEFNRAGWQLILDRYQGRLPVVIRALPEGTVIGTRKVLVVIENTDPELFWLTTWLETALLRAIWYPTTVATTSWQIKQVIKGFLEETGDVGGLPFKLHDFGARGASSLETAALGGMAHLVNFMGTDTISGLMAAREYYSAGVAGFSIPAAEHSTITSWGRAGEREAYRNMVRQFSKPGAIYAVVSDSYDVFNAADKIWGEELKAEVEAAGGLLVIRPDSGDPVAVNRQLIEILGQRFGYTVNDKGFKVLKTVRLIQGDGVNELTIRSILGAFKAMGWSADNIAFGMGGALLQAVDRDTQKFAMKASAVLIGDEWQAIAKDPVTDSGKKSKSGRVITIRNRDGSFREGVEDWEASALEVVYENGVLKREQTFAEVRALAEKG